MKKQLIAGTLALGLFTGGTTATSALASTDDIKSQSTIDVEQVTEEGANPEAIPAVVGAYALKGAAVAGGAFVAGVTAKAGADAYDWAKAQLGGSSVQSSHENYEDVKVVFDQ
ncbi:hypothetical protein GLW00_03320 [Halobacillus litoralis]|uniref:Uncharacterized protein n=1 Tax=Halobacillus litoralis TaxID=45668 RepID=A0A845F6W9_9BACI|nr:MULTISPECIES: hypothetical protein [Halobacillus]MEC3884049.1 hypothetical protein [Halobacillus sp. HZG1]MYL69863.1 hypothetical protein [Halobacillus litoralis]